MNSATNVIQLHNFNNPDMFDELMDDLHYASPNELRKKYASTYNSWSNMRARCSPTNKQYQGCKCHPAFNTFHSFIKHVGERPSAKHTLDRIDPFLKVYSPSNCRWADKATQACNKTNTIVITRPDGSTILLPELAKQQDKTPACLRSRRNRGWTDKELLQGHRGASTPLKSDTVGTATDWNILIHSKKNRLLAEQLYQKNRKHYGSGLRYESRSEYLFRYLTIKIAETHEKLINHIDPNSGAVEPEGLALEEAFEAYSNLFSHASEHWKKARGKVLTHPRYTLDFIHLFRI